MNLVDRMRNHEDFEDFSAGEGWADWMEQFTEEGDGEEPTESEMEDIREVMREAWKLSRTISTYGDIFRDGFVYTEYRDGVAMLADGNGTGWLAVPIDSPEDIYYDDLMGWIYEGCPLEWA